VAVAGDEEHDTGRKPAAPYELNPGEFGGIENGVRSRPAESGSATSRSG